MPAGWNSESTPTGKPLSNDAWLNAGPRSVPIPSRSLPSIRLVQPRHAVEERNVTPPRSASTRNNSPHTRSLDSFA